ncbi:MAG: LptA/OstA family protein [bacterium]|nr:LptA/OstA family protein [bacterium]
MKILLLFIPSFALAAEADTEAIYLEHAQGAEYLKFKDEAGKITVWGEVRLRYKQIHLEADKVELDPETEKILATGKKVVLWDEDRKITGTSLLYDPKTDQGTMLNASSYTEPNLYRGDKIEMIDRRRFAVKGGEFTTCSLDYPHYHLSASAITIRLKDRLVAKNVSLYVGSTPLFYFPFYYKSLKDKRSQSSFRTGHDKHDGWWVKTKYNYSLYNSPGSLLLDWWERKGWGGGLTCQMESRQDREGDFSLYLIDEREVQYDSETREYFKGDEITRRWNVKANYRQILSPTITARARILFQSDELIERDYLSTGSFPRRQEIDSYFTLTKTDPDYYTLNLVAKRKDEWDEDEGKFIARSAQAPQLKFSTTSLQLGKSPVYYSAGFNLTNQFNRIGDEGNYTLFFDTSSGLRGSIKLTPRMTLSPSLNLKGNWENTTGQSSKGVLLNAGYAGQLGLRTRITGFLENDLTYCLNQDIIKPTEDEYHGITLHDLKARLSLRFLKSKVTSNINTRYNLRATKGESLSFKKERFDPVTADLNIKPNKNIGVTARTNYNPATSMMGTISLNANLKSNRPQWDGNFTASYIKSGSGYDPDILFTSHVGLRLIPKVALEADFRYDASEGRLDRQEYIIGRDLHCFQAQFRLMRQPNLSLGEEWDTQVSFRLKLKASPEAEIEYSTEESGWEKWMDKW